MPSIGLELRRERELRGVALSDISKITKISLTFLQALEEDRLNILPGEFFIKGMIRAYAKCIGLDEDQALNLYQHSLQQKELDQVQEKRKKESPILRSRRPHTLWVLSSVGILLAVSVMIIMGFALKKNPPATAAPERTKLRTPAAAATAPPLTAASTAVPAEPAAETLSLRLVFLQETWIQVKADGQIVLAETKRSGESNTLSCRREFVLDTGNAGGFTYTLNGRAGKPLGGPGFVVKNVRIGMDNFRDFLGAQ